MNTKNTFLVLTSSVILAACGSSSSQGTVVPSGDNPTTHPTFGISEFSTNKSKTEHGVLIASRPTISLATNLKENIIIVDGEEISLTNDRLLIDKEGNENAIMAMYYDIAIHGVLAKFFAGGQLTQKMPTSKEDITYKGEAIAEKSKYALASVRLPATFTVNFHDKKLSGKIGDTPHGNIKVEANITGNTFKGEHKFDEGLGVHHAKGSTYVEGGFYGEGASDIAGAYARQGTYTNNGKETDLTTRGVFHAEKQ